MKKLCKSLLKSWCEGLLRLQITNTGSKALDGALLCPACGGIHGRCFEAMYPFLHMAKAEKNNEYIKAAEKLFVWAQNNVSQPDGSFLNDMDSDWKGTTVFNVIQLAECLLLHRDILDEATAQSWEDRLKKAAVFLYGFKELEQNNINYPVANALALHYCGKIFNKQKYIVKAEELAQMAAKHITENGLLFGEGVPKHKRSARGCAPVDIGYNVEETLPSLALYAIDSANDAISKLAYKGLSSHLVFMLSDGGWDNSFGTRNFKWSYWGSRTADGCQLGYMLFADKNPHFAAAAKKNLQLLSSCTKNGLLYGGPHYIYAGEPPCVHHTFAHAKVLAAVLDKNLDCCIETDENETFPQEKTTILKHFPEIATWKVRKQNLMATVTAYDWEYMQGGHVSGGTLSLLYHQKLGMLLCAGMGEFSRKEPANMQVPRALRHECLAMRIEFEENNTRYSSIYDDCAIVELIDTVFVIKGQLCDSKHTHMVGGPAKYLFEYSFAANGVEIKAEFEAGRLICPIISNINENIIIKNQGVTIYKNGGTVEIETKNGETLAPYNEDRIFNLVPGFQALRIDVLPKNQKVHLKINVSF